MPSEQDRAMDKGNMRTKFCEDQTAVSEICSRTDRQTRSSQYFASPTGGEVKMLYKHTMDKILSNVIK